MPCPFKDEDFGVISPRAFKEFSTNEIAGDAEYFSHSLSNSFPNIEDRVRFVNKLYQCFLCQQLPHKVRKLVVVGAKDSGKTSWAKVFFGIVPKEKIAVLTKEGNFGASMIEDDTELLWVDEWTKEMMSEDLLKTMLQGGYFAQAIKHSQPKMQSMQAGVYLTCNKIPDYGAEQENILRRLYICHSTELEEKVNDAPQWIEENAMRCLIWMANLINSNIGFVEKEERFYELPWDVESSAFIKSSKSHQLAAEIKNASLIVTKITPTPEISHRWHPSFNPNTSACIGF